MPDIGIIVIGYTGDAAPPGQYSLLCSTLLDGDSEPRGFDVALNHSANASQKIAAIQNRAVQIWSELGVTIGTADKKTLFGAPSN